RLSMGVQSFVPTELKDLGRPQRPADVDRACAQILDASFPTFNLDLIYGARTQTPESWARSVRRAVAVGPQEIYLYPLYVRALTGLSRVDREPSRHRRALYRVGRDLLLDAGYEQVSMRYFRRATSRAGADYCCQEDGMVGLGPGARSYTRALHYSSEYAVGQVGTKRITAAFNVRERHDVADFGFELDEDEQRRRYLIKSLLRRPGLSAGDYVARFGTSYAADFPGVKEALLARGLAREEGPHLELTDEGFELSDTLGPWLYSASVQSLMVAQELS
ncbi:MAG: coproporphyrinogen III oxidase family protein, partial [Myxococcota bacterium]